jgi:hypothetical protein
MVIRRDPDLVRKSVLCEVVRIKQVENIFARAFIVLTSKGADWKLLINELNGLKCACSFEICSSPFQRTGTVPLKTRKR